MNIKVIANDNEVIYEERADTTPDAIKKMEYSKIESLGVCCGSIIDLITHNFGHYIVYGLSIGLAIGMSLSIALFYMQKDKSKK